VYLVSSEGRAENFVFSAETEMTGKLFSFQLELVLSMRYLNLYVSLVEAITNITYSMQ
jgi:hypothetical protein